MGDPEKTNRTTVLPPLLGVRMAWALTGMFHTEPSGEGGEPSELIKEPVGHYACDLAGPVQTMLADLKTFKDVSEQERTYLYRASISMYAHMRSLCTVYCARELNFTENEVLRLEYLNYIKENINFGAELKDWLKALPTMTIGGVTGLAIAENLGVTGALFWALGFLLAIVGFIVYQWWMVYSCRRKQWTYVMLDFERMLYYKQYIKRAELILRDLYYDLNTIHREVFGERYPPDDPAADEKEMITEFISYLFQGVKPTYCEYLYDHISQQGFLNRMFGSCRTSLCDNPVTPERWPVCETGDYASLKRCPLYQGTCPFPAEPQKPS